MILKYLSAVWAAIAPGLGNHLWQSTLCLALAGLLALVLRKNRAQAHYGLWLAASLKFLIPFSLLVAMGSYLARPAAHAPAESAIYVAIGEVSQPFAKAAVSQREAESRRPWKAGLRYQSVRALTALALGLWLCGILAVLALWWRRWQGLAVTMRKATPLRSGREVEALRRAEQTAGLRRPIGLMLSPASMEPGIFGIVKPVLVWPQGISERLDDVQLGAILAHEVWHVRRRDNLAAAIHMLVEAIFWFHPLVWWLGARLVEERERACDEAVLALGSERQAYAESILKTCEFCVEPPLACMSGISGAELKERIVRIMTQGRANALTYPRKLLLVGAGMAAVAGPVMFGLLKVPQARAQWSPTTGAPAASFEVASIKPSRSGDMQFFVGWQPGRFNATGMTVKFLITMAYDVKDFQVSGGPSWVNSERYDVQAKEPDSIAEELHKLPRGQQEQLDRALLQSLLADRFRLKLTHGTKELPAYALVVAKNGPNLQEVNSDDTQAGVVKAPGGPSHGPMLRWAGRGGITGQDVPVSLLASMLSQQLGRTVLDKTGLKGNYDFTLKWTPEQGEGMMTMGPAGGPPPDGAPPPDASGPSIFTALEEQLGLKLEATKASAEMLVIDHVERPTEN